MNYTHLTQEERYQIYALFVKVFLSILLHSDRSVSHLRFVERSNVIETEMVTVLNMLIDLDVLDATQFRFVLFAQPNIPKNTYDGIAQGNMKIDLVIKVLNNIAQIVDVVDIGIAEHLPRDALALKNMLAHLPLIGEGSKN
ncbi:hypothetical protein D9M71_16590 [compost metagenome]